MTPSLARLITGHVCLHACMAGVRMATPLLALREGRSTLEVGLLLALFALSQVFLAVPAGRFADRHGLRRPIRIGVAVAVVGTGLAAIWPVFAVLCLSALSTGAATGAVSIALQRHVGRSAGDSTRLRQAYSWLSIGPAISNFIGPMVAGLLIDHAGFRWAFAVLALLPIATLVAVGRSRMAAPAAAEEDGAARPHVLQLLRQPSFRRLLVLNWLLSSCWDVHTFAVPLLGHERGLSASAIGAVLGAFAIAATAVRLALPFAAAHLREWRVLSVATALSALLLAVYPFCASAWQMMAGSIALGLVLGVVQPMVMSTLHQVTPAHRLGEALGLRLMTINVASVLMPLLFGSSGALIGVAGVFWGVSAVVACGTPLAIRLRRATPGASHKA